MQLSFALSQKNIQNYTNVKENHRQTSEIVLLEIINEIKVVEYSFFLFRLYTIYMTCGHTYRSEKHKKNLYVQRSNRMRLV